MTFRVKTIDLKEPDLDRPLYRIYSIWFFEMALITNGGRPQGGTIHTRTRALGFKCPLQAAGKSR
jgi:hypothetical protein